MSQLNQWQHSKSRHKISHHKISKLQMKTVICDSTSMQILTQNPYLHIHKTDIIVGTADNLLSKIHNKVTKKLNNHCKEKHQILAEATDCEQVHERCMSVWLRNKRKSIIWSELSSLTQCLSIGFKILLELLHSILFILTQNMHYCHK